MSCHDHCNEDKVQELEEKVEHQRECIDWLKMVVEKLAGKKCCDRDCE